MENKIRAHLATVFIVLMIYPLLTCGCVRHVYIDKQTEYHEEVSGLEEYLLDHVGEYLRFEKPAIDEVGKNFGWNMKFVSDYTRDENLLAEHPYLEIMENTRQLFNDYLEANPEYYLNDGYNIECRFILAPDGSPDSTTHEELLGTVSNAPYPYDVSYLRTVDYVGLINIVPGSDLSFEGVEYITLPPRADLDSAIAIVDSFPDLKQVTYYSDYGSDLAELRPEIEVIDHRE